MSNETTDNNCPRCGAESNKLEEPSWECGSFHSLTTHFEYHTDLCHEREARQRLEAENAKLRETNQEDLAKLTEAVELGTKQAEEFDKIYTKLRKLLEVAIEVAEDALEERDLKRRIADEIGSLKAELNRLPKS